MIRIWHDDAVRWLPLWLIITMLNTSVLMGIALWRQAARGDDLQPPVASLLVILWLAVAFHILFGRVRTRCQRIEMTLPIRSRTLWRKHLAVVFLTGAGILAGSLAVLAFHANLLSKKGPLPPLEVPYTNLIGPLLAGLLLAATLVESVEPGLQRLHGKSSYWALVLGSLVAIPLLLLLLIDWPLASSGACIGSAIFLIFYTQRSLPAAYRLVPAAALSAAAEKTVAATSDRPASRWQVHRILFDILHTAPPWKQFTPWMLYVFVTLMGFLLAGGFNRWDEIAVLRFLYLPFGTYLLFAGMGILTYNLYRLDSLPVSRRTILAVLTLPGLLFYCVGYGAGWWVRTTDPGPPPLVDFKVWETRVDTDPLEAGTPKPQGLRTMVWVEVAWRFMGVSLSGEAPTLTAPWGESHVAWSEALFPGSPAILYSPYNTPEETSVAFEALMLSRAVQDIYGQSIPPEELRQRYFVVEEDQVVGLTSDVEAGPQHRSRAPRGITLLKDYPQLEAPRQGPETAVYMLIVLVPWLLLTALFLHSFKAIRSNRYIRGIYWLGLALPMLALLSQVILSLFGWFNPDAGRGFLAILIQSLGTGTASWLLTWIGVLAAVLMCYRLALGQFERAEIPTSPINCSMVSWGREE